MNRSESISRTLSLPLLVIIGAGLLAACTGETRPDKEPAPVEDRGIPADNRVPVVLSRASEVAPMQQARPEPSASEAPQPESRRTSEPSPPPRQAAPAEPEAEQQALFQTVQADEPAPEPLPEPVLVKREDPQEAPIRSSRELEKTTPEVNRQKDEDEATEVALLQTSRPGGDRAPPAVSALTADAERAIRARDYGKASASLERALRMEPRDAYLWHRLAYTRLQQGKDAQAESLALKSNSLAGDKQELVNSNWRLISRSRKQRDDLGGAEQALQQIR